VLARVLELSPGDRTQVLLLGEDSYLTRFSQNHIHQNVGESNASLQIKVHLGKRVGSAGTNVLSEEGIRLALEQAAAAAAVQRENPELPGLPEPRDIPDLETCIPRTVEFSAEQRADAVGEIISQARSRGSTAAGAFSTGVREIGVAHSEGLRAYTQLTSASLSTVVMSDDSSGYAAAASRDVDQIDAGAVGRRAVEKCESGRHAVALEPGEYTAILEPEAAAELVSYVSRLGFSALAVQEGRSFVCDRLGDKVVGDNISIWDDGLDTRGLALPFDFEGVPKSKVHLLENGTASQLLYDMRTAARAGRDSTGHATPYAAFGPMAFNLFMAPGDSSLEEMIASTERGVLVTRFHYTNPVHPKRVIITGMTRDGTYLIEKGKVVSAIKNLRFTQSFLDALNNVEAISRDTRLIGGFFGGSVVPALKVARFAFTGATEH